MDWVYDVEGGVFELLDEIGEVVIGFLWLGENGVEFERKKICFRLWLDMCFVVIISMDGVYC